MQMTDVDGAGAGAVVLAHLLFDSIKDTPRPPCRRYVSFEFSSSGLSIPLLSRQLVAGANPGIPGRMQCQWNLLLSCLRTESPYVMVTSLEVFAILRPFDKRKIQCRQSDDSRREGIRLAYLCLHTIIQRAEKNESGGRLVGLIVIDIERLERRLR